MTTIWLASYPRSGNTVLRMILFQCFGLQSGSVYPADLTDNARLQQLVGHVELSRDGRELADQPLKPIKTHEFPMNDAPAIYVVRNGLDVVRSMAKFYEGHATLRQIIDGPFTFGTWAGHLEAWKPRLRPKTLLVRYEDIVGDFDGTLDRLGGFLNLQPKQRTISSREEVAAVDGHWVRGSNAAREELAGPLLDRFWAINGQTMKRLGYD